MEFIVIVGGILLLGYVAKTAYEKWTTRRVENAVKAIDAEDAKKAHEASAAGSK